ncbi:hypothetical protein Taro_022580 [Colocasia esculenta]|uniref:YDG domain-containing protein n=1 Tax=Colocasia esculenta TaxID=4460 RepID=A0A843V1Y3_COLES|nr:hypothetical protein [Colocasia esculenta]
MGEAAAVKLFPTKPCEHCVVEPEEGELAAVTVASAVPPRVKNISDVASRGRRCSPRLEGRRNLNYDERGSSVGISERRGRKKRKLDDGNQGLETQSPAESTVKAIEEGDGQTDACMDAHYQVVKTLRIFNKHYLHFVQEEEQRVRTIDAKVSKPNWKGREFHLTANTKWACCAIDFEELIHLGVHFELQLMAHAREEDEQITKRGSKRPDLKAISRMLDEQTFLYPQKRIGHLPGIDVGRHFFSRAEMVVLGLHSHWLNGIDYMGKSYSKLAEYEQYSFPLAICIVLSGMYEDDLDNSDDVIYTGQGGHDLLGNKRQIRDQKMERGNLALKVCFC